MSRVCYVQRLSYLGFVMSSVCYVWLLFVQGLLCLAFVCLGFVVSSVCLSRVGYGTIPAACNIICRPFSEARAAVTAGLSKLCGTDKV